MTPQIVHPHRWTPAEKQINCQACLLAASMRDCKSCAFYTPAEIRPAKNAAAIRAGMMER